MLGICAEAVSPGEVVSVDRALMAGAAKLCPHAPDIIALRGDIADDGKYAASATDPEGVKPGTYRGAAGAQGCYWERTTSSGATIDNDFVTYAPAGPAVTIRPSDGGFTSQDCGPWKRLR